MAAVATELSGVGGGGNAGGDWQSSVEPVERLAPSSIPTGMAAAGEYVGPRQRRPHPQQQPAQAQQSESPAPAAASLAEGSAPAAMDRRTLCFADPALEVSFAQHYPRVMWRTDLVALVLHACFYCILLFTPGPLGHLAWKLPWHTSIRGFSYVIWIPFMSIPRLRPWYLRHRDIVLCLMLAGMTCYMLSVGNHQRWVDPDFATHPMFQGGFSWIAFSLCFLQPRILYHRYSAVLLFAGQLPALHTYCQDHFGAHVPSCLAIGAFKTAVLAIIPLAAVYYLEGKARRIFLRQVSMQLGTAVQAAQAGQAAGHPQRVPRMHASVSEFHS